jgi:hypothetical protein
MAQTVSRRPVTAEAWVRAVVSSCRTLWWTKLHWDGVFSDFFTFPCQYHSVMALHTHLSPAELTTGLLLSAVQRSILSHRHDHQQQQCFPSVLSTEHVIFTLEPMFFRNSTICTRKSFNRIRSPNLSVIKTCAFNTIKAVINNRRK